MAFSSPEPLGLICSEPRDQETTDRWDENKECLPRGPSCQGGGGRKLTGEVVRKDVPQFRPHITMLLDCSLSPMFS